MTSPQEVLEFWFPADAQRANKLWWGKDEALDAEIRARFGPLLAEAKAGKLDAWVEEPASCIALIIVLDQFSRNIHRGDPETHAADAKALALAYEGLERGHDQQLPTKQRLFFYLPLEHSEALADQERCLELVRKLAADVAADPESSEGARKMSASFINFAISHRDIVARFGRFPHRNALLGRDSTPEELEFLTQPGSSF